MTIMRYVGRRISPDSTDPVLGLRKLNFGASNNNALPVHAGIDAMIAGVQARFPGFVLKRTSKVDCHNGSARFSWSLGPAAGPPVVEGVDFCALGEDGRLASLVGFIDKM